LSSAESQHSRCVTVAVTVEIIGQRGGPQTNQKKKKSGSGLGVTKGETLGNTQKWGWMEVESRCRSQENTEEKV